MISLKIKLLIFILVILLFSACQRNGITNLSSVDTSRMGVIYGIPNGIETGGGSYYSDIFYSGDYIINQSTDISVFINILNTAPDGSVIFIEDNTILDLTSKPEVMINNQIIIAGCRNGNNNEALIKSDKLNGSIFKINSNNVRFSGLRIEGSGNSIGKLRAISLTDYSNLIVDNCEISDFTSSGIYLNNSLDNSVHDNYIHDNRQIDPNGDEASSYGIILCVGAYVVAYQNDFEMNWHDIAGDGREDTGYEAYYNRMINNSIGTNFDMHGEYHNTQNPKNINAGSFISIHHNNFEDDSSRAIGIRGFPRISCEVYNNSFAHNNLEKAVVQLYRPPSGEDMSFFNMTPMGNMNIYSNQANSDNPGMYISWTGRNEFYRALTSPISTSNLIPTDFDGDGRNEIFDADGIIWKILRFDVAWGRIYDHLDPWQCLNASEFTISDLAFGDFNGDGETDVFTATGSQWLVSWSGTTSWSHLCTSTYELSDLAFGDFNGDGETDVFTATGSQWLVSWSGNSNWSHLRKSSSTLSEFVFGDFNGDRRTDVFTATGSQWLVSWSGTSNWTILKSSIFTLDELTFADFDGDRCTDVIICNSIY